MFVSWLIFFVLQFHPKEDLIVSASLDQACDVQLLSSLHSGQHRIIRCN
jgi:hypothetical protein